MAEFVGALSGTATSAAPDTPQAPALEIPTWKGRPGWEFTDLTGFDMAAYEAAPAGRTPGADALWELETGVLPDGVRVEVGEIETVVTVAANVAMTEPISLATVAAAGTLVNQRTHVVLEPGAQAEVWEQFLAEGDATVNVVTELTVGDNATLRYVSGQNLPDTAWIFGDQRAQVGRDATLDWVALGFGGRSGHVLMSTRLVGQGASARVTGAYATHGRQHVDFDTTQEHAAENTVSDLAFRGVLTDRSSAVWKGNIIVDPGAQKTDAFQESRNLLLSRRAHADAIPGLEIQANDVRCTHAAAVAQVDPEQIFYLKSHGLSEADAKRLVIEGFLEALVERFEEGPVRERLSAALEGRLATIL
ncbi:Fe-S cluster assembly protein SufD [Conexibacter sp. DBS9H8]|uniref:Fe-S cluster assembly protein SufD n=1 Tax=Conexibacter sp. DBS9H8 TaxID=2937801 RepID=UPI00200E8176|nr:Fe-S cluster assembly protein SufD [Conexibacter sp. DBS9H8]